jgi:predicted Zn-dependent protease
MPKRKVEVISHSSLTNHRIPAKPDEPIPEIAFHQTTAALPDLIHLNPAPGRKDSPLPPLTLLQAYGELMDRKPEYAPRYAALLTQLEHSEPDNSLVQAALGRRDLRAGKLDEAAGHLERALQLGPPQVAAYSDLAEVMVKQGRSAEAVPLLQKAIALEPYNSTLQKTLVLRLIQLQRYPEAESAMEQYVKSFPEDSFMRQMLARAQGAGTPK